MLEEASLLSAFEKGNVTSKVHLFESLNQNHLLKCTSFDATPPKSSPQSSFRHSTPNSGHITAAFRHSYRPIQHHFMLTTTNVKKMQDNCEKNLNLMHIDSVLNYHASEIQEEIVIFHRLPGEPLGLELHLDKTNTKWCVGSIVPQSTIDRISTSGMKSCIEIGDYIVAINGIKLSTLTYNEMISVLRDLPVRVTVTFQRDSVNKQPFKHPTYNSNLYDSSTCSKINDQIISQLQDKYKSLSIESLTSVTSCDSKMSYFSDNENQCSDYEMITVTMFKEKGEFLGLNVINGKKNMAHYYQIKRISDNGLIQKAKQLHLGDYLYSMNGTFLMGISETKLVRILQNAEGTVELIILRSENEAFSFQSWNPDDGLDVDQCFMGFSFYQHVPKTRFNSTKSNEVEMICKLNYTPDYFESSSDKQRKITRLFPAHLDCAVQTSGFFQRRSMSTDEVSTAATRKKNLLQKLAQHFLLKRSNRNHHDDEIKEETSAFRSVERSCTNDDDTNRSQRRTREFSFHSRINNKCSLLSETSGQDDHVELYHVTEKKEKLFHHEQRTTAKHASSESRFASFKKLLCTFSRNDSVKKKIRLKDQVEKQVLHLKSAVSERSSSFYETLSHTSLRRRNLGSGGESKHFSLHNKLSRSFSSRSCIKKHERKNENGRSLVDSEIGYSNDTGPVMNFKRSSRVHKVNFSTVSSIDPAELEASFQYLEASSSSENKNDVQ